jgi:hypothetical protein
MGFVNLLFLAGAAAIAGPIFAHLLLRSRPRRYELPTLRFLMPTAPQSYSRHRLKNILLLAVRTFIILILVFAFARPYFKSGDETNAADLADLGAVFAVDTSLSMQAADRWNDAKEKVRQLAATLPPQSPVALVTFDSAAEVPLPSTRALGELNAALAAIAPGYGTTDYAAATRVALDTAANLPARLKRIYVVSDFQRTAVPDAAIPVAGGEFVEVLPTIVSADNDTNWTIAGAAASHPGGLQRQVQVLATSYASETRDGRVALLRGNDEVAAADVTLKPGESIALDFTFDADSPEDVQLSATISLDDALSADNMYYLISKGIKPIAVAVAERTGVVMASASSAAPEGANPYLAAALAACESLVAPQWVQPNELANANAAVVILPDASVLSDAELAQLAERVRNGAALVAFPGRTLSDAFAELAGVSVEARPATRIDPAKYNLVTSTAATGPFAAIEKSNAALLGHPRAYHRFVLNPLPDSGAQTIATLDDGAAYLLERPVGDGVVYLFATSLDAAATDLVLRAAFAPFLYELIVHAADQAGPAIAYAVGDTIRVDDASQRLDAPGLFARAGSSSIDLPYAVNADRRESDLTPAEADAIANLFVETAAAADSSQLKQPSEEEPDAANRFWRYLAIAALGLMATETFLASRTVR